MHFYSPLFDDASIEVFFSSLLAACAPRKLVEKCALAQINHVDGHDAKQIAEALRLPFWRLRRIAGVVPPPVFSWRAKCPEADVVTEASEFSICALQLQAASTAAQSIARLKPLQNFYRNLTALQSAQLVKALQELRCEPSRAVAALALGMITGAIALFGKPRWLRRRSDLWPRRTLRALDGDELLAAWTLYVDLFMSALAWRVADRELRALEKKALR